MTALPFVDRHSIEFKTSNVAIWVSLMVIINWKLVNATRFAKVLGCEPDSATVEYSGKVGETLPGFRVTEVIEGERLVLTGRHRFSRYQLTFLIEGHHLYVDTHAEFPGVLGRLYKAAVIYSGAHAAVTKSMLREIESASR
jgi:hypothetical protein